MSLRARFALSSAAIILIAIAIAGLGARASANAVATHEADRFLRKQVEKVETTQDNRELAAALGVDPRCLDQLNERRCERSRSNPFGDVGIAATRVIVRQNDGVIFQLGDFNLALSQLEFERDSMDEPGFEEFETVDFGGVQLRILTSNLDEGIAVQSVRDLDDVGAALQGLLRRVALFGAIGAMAAAFVAWLLARSATRPIEQLTATAERVTMTRDLSERIPTGRTDEVGRLAVSFNTMLEAIETSQHQQKRLVQDANHELRTPLTSLRTNIELLERAPDLDEVDRSNLLRDVRGELNELTDLVEELVESATDITTNDEPLQQVELNDLAQSVAELSRRRTGRIITVETTDPALVSVRVSMIERAIRNLLSNAAKFSPEATPINVRVDGTTVEVSDFGPGIEADEREQVFERFFRSNRDRSAPGSGLGLSIVKQIVDAHDGRVWADEAATGGARVGFDIAAARIDDPSVEDDTGGGE